MNKTTSLLLFIVLVLCAVYLMKPSGANQELLRREVKYKNQIDSIKTKYRELIKEDSITFIEYQKLFYKWQKADENAKAWERKYRKEMGTRRTFTDKSIDSLLSKVPG